MCPRPLPLSHVRVRSKKEIVLLLPTWSECRPQTDVLNSSSASNMPWLTDAGVFYDPGFWQNGVLQTEQGACLLLCSCPLFFRLLSCVSRLVAIVNNFQPFR